MTEILSKELIERNRTFFFRFFLSLLVFELRGVVFLTPPPPPWRRWLRPPPGRGLIRLLGVSKLGVLALHSKTISKI